MPVLSLVLTIIFILLGLIAGLLIPSKKKILARQITVYKKWKQLFVYIVGIVVIIGGVFLFLLLWISRETVQNAQTIINFVLLIGIGIVLVEENYRKSMSLQKVKEVIEVPIAGTSETFPIRCGKCGNIINITTSLKGETIVCPYCGTPGKMKESSVKVKHVKIPQETISIKCGGCGSEIKITSSLIGKIIKCPHCGVKGKIG